MRSGEGKQVGEKNHSLAAVENSVNEAFSGSEVSKWCMCDICLENYEMRQKDKEFVKQSRSMFKIDMEKMKTFYRFLAAGDRKNSFKVQIPELCFLEAGEGKCFFKSKSNGIMMAQLSSETRKEIPNLFLESKRLSREADLNFAAGQSNHIKYFQSIVPSFKHGLSNDNLGNRPKNYKFHSKESKSEDTEMFKMHQKSAPSEIAIIKYQDESLELVNEKQLKSLFKTPNNNLSKTKNIDLIQAYIRPHQDESEFICADFVDHRKPQNVLMYNRSLVQVKTDLGLVSKFSRDYIPSEVLQEYETTLLDMPEEYCLYQTYKMVHFVEITQDVRVRQLSTVWFKDEYKEIIFYGATQFGYEANQQVKADLPVLNEANQHKQEQTTELEKELLSLWENVKKKKMQELKKNKEEDDDYLMELQMIKMESTLRPSAKLMLSKQSSQSVR